MITKLFSKLCTVYCPLIQYTCYMESESFLIKETSYSFDKNNLSKEELDLIFQGILSECIKLMNPKNKDLIMYFFKNIHTFENIYNDFTNIILFKYINNLTEQEQRKLEITGYFNPYLKYNIVESYKIGIHTIAMATIKIRDDGIIKIKYPKCYSTASLIPLILAINMYKYFTDFKQ